MSKRIVGVLLFVLSIVIPILAVLVATVTGLWSAPWTYLLIAAVAILGAIFFPNRFTATILVIVAIPGILAAVGSSANVNTEYQALASLERSSVMLPRLQTGNTPLHQQVRRQFAAVSQKNVEAVLADLADDVVIYDPHYPQPLMRGKAQIATGLAEAFDQVDAFGFSELRYLESPEGDTALVVMLTTHTLKRGSVPVFAQFFWFEARGGRIVYVQAGTPYTPPGLGGVAIGIFGGRFLARYN